MSSAFVFAPVLLFLAIIVLLLPVLLRLLRQCHLRDIAPDWLENFSPVVYRPMELLLAEEDFDFLIRQPGFDASISKKLRRDRIEIFRLYLKRMIADFNRLHKYGRYLVAQSAQDQSKMLNRLIWLRARFSFAVVKLEMSLWLAYFGFRPRIVGRALSCLDEMNGFLYSLAAA